MVPIIPHLSVRSREPSPAPSLPPTYADSIHETQSIAARTLSHTITPPRFLRRASDPVSGRAHTPQLRRRRPFDQHHFPPRPYTRLSDSSSSDKTDSDTEEDTPPPQDPPPIPATPAPEPAPKKANLLQRLLRELTTSAPLQRLRTVSARYERSYYQRRHPVAQPHTLAPAIYTLSITHRSPRCTLSYTAGATAVYIGDGLFLAPARCVRLADPVLSSIELLAAAAPTADPLPYTDLPKRKVPGTLELAVAGYLDRRHGSAPCLPADVLLDLRYDLVLLRHVGATHPANTAAARPAVGPAVLSSVVFVGVNKETVITPYTMARYPRFVTEPQLRAVIAALRPGCVTASAGRGWYADLRRDAVVRRPGRGGEPELLACAINVTDDTPGGAVALERSGMEMLGIHLATQRLRPSSGGSPEEAECVELSANVAVHFDTARFREFARLCVLPNLRDEGLKRHWSRFIRAGRCQDLVGPGHEEWRCVPPTDVQDRDGVWMDYVEKK